MHCQCRAWILYMSLIFWGGIRIESGNLRHGKGSPITQVPEVRAKRCFVGFNEGCQVSRQE